MPHHTSATRSDATGSTPSRRDDGSALVLVLVLLVIGSLIVIPLMQYTMAVTRANTVLSDKTERLEAVKSGLRVSLADPESLYEVCGAGGPTTPVTLAPVTIGGMTVSNRCFFVDYQAAQSADEIRRGVVATQMGQPLPAMLRGTTWAPTGTDPQEWWAQTTKASETDMIWLPNLPTHGLNQRTPGGHDMPAGYPTCRVYFPGTYVDPITINGPTYFASGIYYFENTVTVAAGANVVVGQGAELGCATDQEAAFYAINAPTAHNIGGLGGTWVFGDRGRLVVDNTGATPISFVFNSRYVAEGDPGVAPSAGVSILSVNGELDASSNLVDLDFPGQLRVPLSMVGADPDPDDPSPVAPVPATAQAYLPSRFTPKPTAPEVPTGVTANRRIGGAIVTWTAPFDGGSPITGYSVTASTGGGCTTLGATTCAITGLPATPVTFTVVASNAVGSSPTSAPSASITPGGSTTMAVPAAPAAPAAVPYNASARVSWTAPSDGGAPIIRYIVTANPGGQTCTVEMATATPPPLRCDVTGLTNATPVTFSVVAVNAVGSSPASLPSASATPQAALGSAPATPPTTPSPFLPTPILDFQLTSNTAVSVRIPGYISLPQGRVRVNNPHGLAIETAGGILAAQFDITDGRATGPQSVPMGFIETIVQRKFRIVSTTSAGLETSTAIVQINQNGAYAINSWEVQ